MRLVLWLHQRLRPSPPLAAPDIGTDERMMAYIFDEYSRFKGFSPACVTGKVGGTQEK